MLDQIPEIMEIPAEDKPKTFFEQRMERIQAQKDEPDNLKATDEQVTALTQAHEALAEADNKPDNRLAEILKKQKEEQEKQYAAYKWDAPLPFPEIFGSDDLEMGLYKMICLPIDIKVSSELGLISMTDQEVKAQFWSNPLARIVKIGPCAFKGHRMRDLGVTPETAPQVGDYIWVNPKAPDKLVLKGIQFVVINDEDYKMRIKPALIKEFLGIKEDVPGDSAAVREYEQPELPLPLKQMTEEAA